MDELLYKYLIQHKQVCIPTLGTLVVNRVPAVEEFGSKSFIAPRYEISFDQSKDVHSKKLFHWLALVFDCTELDVVKKLNAFGFEMKQQLLLGNKIYWHGVGTFSRLQQGTIKLDAEPVNLPFEQPVYIEKVIRESARHQVRVGEEYRDSEQMSELLAATPGIKKSSSWIWALIVILLALGIIGYVFYTRGFTGNATGLQQKLKTEQPAVLHRNLP